MNVFIVLEREKGSSDVLLEPFFLRRRFDCDNIITILWKIFGVRDDLVLLYGNVILLRVMKTVVQKPVANAPRQLCRMAMHFCVKFGFVNETSCRSNDFKIYALFLQKANCLFGFSTRNIFRKVVLLVFRFSLFFTGYQVHAVITQMVFSIKIQKEIIHCSSLSSRPLYSIDFIRQDYSTLSDILSSVLVIFYIFTFYFMHLSRIYFHIIEIFPNLSFIYAFSYALVLLFQVLTLALAKCQFRLPLPFVFFHQKSAFELSFFLYH